MNKAEPTMTSVVKEMFDAGGMKAWVSGMLADRATGRLSEAEMERKLELLKQAEKYLKMTGNEPPIKRDKNLVSEERRKEIGQRLVDVEKQEGVRILYACESGSRAWGFPSSDSDYDVRFIYAHPVEWYVSVKPGRDVIERPLDNLIDLSGWDVRKALGLLRGSNPPLLEWMQSPIVYFQNEKFMMEMETLLSFYYSPRSCMYHYIHMAQGNVREYLKGDRVWTKKYFYVLRPLLACLWIEAGRGIVPMEFRRLLAGVTLPSDLRGTIERLLEDKLAGREMDDGPRIPIIHEFLEHEITRLQGVVERVKPRPIPDDAELDKALRRIIGGPGVESRRDLAVDRLCGKQVEPQGGDPLTPEEENQLEELLPQTLDADRPWLEQFEEAAIKDKTGLARKWLNRKVYSEPDIMSLFGNSLEGDSQQ